MHSRALPFALCVLFAVSTFAYTQDNDLTPPNPAVAEWNQHIAGVTAAIGTQVNCAAPTIVDAAQFSGHGPSVALVKPCPTGDRANQITVLILENGKPVVAQFLDPFGKPMTPKIERSKSALKPRDVQLDPRHKEILTTAQDRDDHNQFLGCIAAVYSWNERTNTFDWDTKRSKKQFGTYCAH